MPPQTSQPTAQNAAPSGPSFSMSPDQFAQSIKAKYPQYESLSNTDLTQKMLAKFPQYQSVVQMPKQESGLWSAIKGVGNFLAPIVGDVYHDIAGDSQKTGLQQLGDLGSTALTAATLIPGLGPEALAAKIGLTGAKTALEGANVAEKVVPSFLSRLGSNAGLGAAYGATGALGAGETDPGNILGSTALGAGLGGAIAGAGQLGKYALGKTAGGGLPGKIIEDTLPFKQGAAESAENFGARVDRTVKTVQGYGAKTVNGMITEADSSARDLNNQINGILKSDAYTGFKGTVPVQPELQGVADLARTAGSYKTFVENLVQNGEKIPGVSKIKEFGQTVMDAETGDMSAASPFTSLRDFYNQVSKNQNSISIPDLLSSVAKSYGQSGGAGTLTSAEIQKTIQRVAPEVRGLLSQKDLSLANANRLRKALDKNLGDKFFNMKNPAYSKEVLGAFNGVLRGLVKARAPETIPLFAKEQAHIQALKALRSVASKKGGGLITKGDAAATIGGFFIGGPLGAGVTELAKKTAESPSVRLGGANLLNRLGKVKVPSQIPDVAKISTLRALLGGSPQSTQ